MATGRNALAQRRVRERLEREEAEERSEAQAEAQANDDAILAEQGDEAAAGRLRNAGGGARAEAAAARGLAGAEQAGAQATTAAESGQEPAGGGWWARTVGAVKVLAGVGDEGTKLTAEGSNSQQAEAPQGQQGQNAGDATQKQGSHAAAAWGKHVRGLQDRPSDTVGQMAVNLGKGAAKVGVGKAKDYGESLEQKGTGEATTSVVGDAAKVAGTSLLMGAGARWAGRAVGAVISIGALAMTWAGGSGPAVGIGARVGLRIGVRGVAMATRALDKVGNVPGLGWMKGAGNAVRKSADEFLEGMADADRVLSGGVLNMGEAALFRGAAAAVGGGVRKQGETWGQHVMRAAGQGVKEEAGKSKDTWTWIFKASKEKAGKGLDWAKGAVARGVETGKDVAGKAAKIARNPGDAVIAAAKATGHGLQRGWTAAKGKVGNAVAGAALAAREGAYTLASVPGKAGGWLAEKGRKVKEAAGEGLQSLKNAPRAVRDKFVAVRDDTVDGIRNLMHRVGNAPRTALAGAQRSIDLSYDTMRALKGVPRSAWHVTRKLTRETKDHLRRVPDEVLRKTKNTKEHVKEGADTWKSAITRRGGHEGGDRSRAVVTRHLDDLALKGRGKGPGRSLDELAGIRQARHYMKAENLAARAKAVGQAVLTLGAMTLSIWARAASAGMSGVEGRQMQGATIGQASRGAAREGMDIYRHLRARQQSMKREGEGTRSEAHEARKATLQERYAHYQPARTDRTEEVKAQGQKKKDEGRGR